MLKTNLIFSAVFGVLISLYIGILLAMSPHVLKENMAVLILIPLPLALLFGYLLGKMVSVRIIRPIKEITDTANRITHEDLSLRVQAAKADEELSSLITAFNGMISRLEESFEYITDSSSYIAHELKTPIAIIRGEAEYALKKERDREEYKRVIQIGLEESKRMLKTIGDLLLLTRMNYQADVLKYERIDLTQFVRILCEQAKILAHPRDIQVNAGIPSEAGMVNADESYLRRLFLNLIDNAIKYTPAGGNIGITLKYEGSKAAVSISDTGIGIPEKDLPKLFDKFFRIDGRIKESTPGSGLGLSISQSIAKLHNGEISVTSKVNSGTVFTVTLPASPAI